MSSKVVDNYHQQFVLSVGQGDGGGPIVKSNNSAPFPFPNRLLMDTPTPSERYPASLYEAGTCTGIWMCMPTCTYFHCHKLLQIYSLNLCMYMMTIHIRCRCCSRVHNMYHMHPHSHFYACLEYHDRDNGGPSDGAGGIAMVNPVYSQHGEFRLILKSLPGASCCDSLGCHDDCRIVHV